MTVRLQTTAMLLALSGATMAYAQQTDAAAPTAVAVPKLVRFSGSYRSTTGTAAQSSASSVESMTLSVYRDQTGGNALWHEIQNVVVDSDGRYSVLMGATQNDGMPLDLFTSGEPRWLGVQVNRSGEAEQPRVLLVSVPYALKSADADTLGGRPASAYLLAEPTVGTDSASVAGATAAATTIRSAAKPKTTPANSGIPNYIGKFVNSTDLIDSAMYEINGNVGIFTTNPLISLDVRTGALPQMGIAGATDYLTFFASDKYGPAIYWDPALDMRFGKGGTGLYSATGFVEYLRIKSSNGNVGVGTMAPASKLDVNGDINLNGGIRFGGTILLQSPGAFGNIALGLGALQSIAGGFDNTAIGTQTLVANTTGSHNTALGYSSLANTTTANGNTGVGASTLVSNTTGANNTAVGYTALSGNQTGQNNTAIGMGSLIDNTTGHEDVAVGATALAVNTIGAENTAIGYGALASNLSGTNNTAIGFNAGNLISSGNGNNIDIGNSGTSSDVGIVRIGTDTTQTAFFAAGIRGVTTGNNDAIPVVIDSAGQLGTVSSSRRFKEDIEDMGAASRDLMRLRPVTYRYKAPFADGSKPIQFGLIAEEVAEVYPDLVAHSADGKIETVKYQVLDSMLLNEVQRQQAEIHGLVQQVDQERQQNQSLQERLAKLEAALASMSAARER